MTKSLNEKAQAAAEEIALEFEPISSHQRNTLTTIANRTILRHFSEEQTPPQSLDAIVEKWRYANGITPISDFRSACEECAKELQSQLTTERDKVKELEKDKERLDWVENQSATLLAMRVGNGFMLRSSIDSAIAKQKGEKV